MTPQKPKQLPPLAVEAVRVLSPAGGSEEGIPTTTTTHVQPQPKQEERR